MKKSLKSYALMYRDGVLNSYGLIFFTKDRWFSLILLLLSMLDYRLGLGGLAAVLLTSIVAHVLGFSKKKIRSGAYGFNAIFVGISLVYKFYVTSSFIILFIFSIILVFMFTIWLESVFAKHDIPVLTLPFVLTLFIVDLAVKTFTNIESIVLFDRFTTVLAEQMRVPWYPVVHALDNVAMPSIFFYYFKTLASVFFTDSIGIGIAIAVALLFQSRIKSTVAFMAFFFAFFTSKLLGVDIQELTRDLAGVNYIFWGMAIGSFFIIPNIYSYWLVIGLTPALFLFYASIEGLISGIGLSSYTLPFSMLSILVLFILKQRSLNRFFIFPYIQYFNPEKTVYKNVNYMQRFAQNMLFKLHLPLLGEWFVSQGYDGTITHLGAWGKALDFVITDDNGATCFGRCAQKEDFYCYNKPVLAPADGYVYMISNITEDNDINDVNTRKNWGNSIIINHLNGLYTQISHLKKDSFNVRIGDYVTKGTVLASCGNSGRSPEPHVHFQVQLTPEIGAVTHPYPIGYFFEKTEGKPVLHIGEVPKENTVVFNVQPSLLAQDAFDGKPGRTLKVGYDNEEYSWSVATDEYNKTYIRCERSHSTAYVENDGTMFYFTGFEGKKSSPLYLFYQSCFKLLLSNEKDIPVSDKIPLTNEHPGATRWFQDFLAPFVIFTQINYRSQLNETDNMYYPERMVYQSYIDTTSFNIKLPQKQSTITVVKNRIEINSKKHALCIDWG